MGVWFVFPNCHFAVVLQNNNWEEVSNFSNVTFQNVHVNYPYKLMEIKYLTIQIWKKNQLLGKATEILSLFCKVFNLGIFSKTVPIIDFVLDTSH